MQQDKDTTKKEFLDRISPFSLILSMIILMIMGVSLIPMIRISYFPTDQGSNRNITIGYSWQGASARAIEQEITSKIEGIAGSVIGVESVSSSSSRNNGIVTAILKKDANPSAVRFELSSMIKQIYPKLPEGVSYPSIGGASAASGIADNNKLLLSYQINADMKEEQIQEYAIKTILPRLERIDGVKNVNVSGATAKCIEITYDPLILKSYKLNAGTLSQGISNFLGRAEIVGDVEKLEQSGDMGRISVLLESSKLGNDLRAIPIANIDGKMIYLNNLATINYKDVDPNSYFRINGLNTIYLNVSVDASSNLISMSQKIRDEVEDIKTTLQDGYHITLTRDGAEQIKNELYKLIRRTVLSLVILMLFVWFANRNIRYLSIIFITLLANVLISLILYYVLDIELHIYSLAGIAVSFGIIIDTSIVMVDHYGYYKNRRVFIAILAALLTTIGSLVIIFFMPDSIKRDLADFAAIIIINLSVALVISLLFVPAIITKMKFSSTDTKKRISVRRRLVKFSHIYYRYISFTQKRKWIYITLLIIAFGIPIHLLPARWGQAKGFYIPKSEQKEEKWYETAYNKTIGGSFYQGKLKKPLETYLGGTMRLFANGSMSMGRQGNYRQTAPELRITAKMPQGSSVTHLNEKVSDMERFLAKFDEISKFTTNIDGRGANINVEFKDEFHGTSIPMYIKNMVISHALTIGGADWGASGIDDKGFSNALNLDHKSNSIELTGYNFDRLYRYAEDLRERLSENRRITDLEVSGDRGRNVSYFMSQSQDEMYIKYNKELLALYKIDPAQSYNSLSEMLAIGSAGTYTDADGNRTSIKMISSQRDNYDIWHLYNAYVEAGDGQIRFSRLGEINKRKANQTITKKNQSYSLDVNFNFNGPYEISRRYLDEQIEKTNALLPVGFRCGDQYYHGSRDRDSEYWLILVIVAIIFFTCSILFESLRQPLVIISLIPLSFIGTFLTFYFTKLDFGSGGFASLVLLSGLVVNAAIYIINEYNNFMRTSAGGLSNVSIYVKSFNHKIIPVLLTILSTVLGLIPFLIDGPKEQFWFSFAVGTSGGLLFSIVALVFILPIIMPLKPRKK